MAKEIWIWILEKLALLRGHVWRLLVNGWRRVALWLGDISASSWKKIAITVPLVFLIYILVGMLVVNRIDDRMDVNPDIPAGFSHSVAMTSYLVAREAQDHNWVPNDPWFLPGHWLDNTPAYQKGIVGALSRFAFELRDQIGRTRGSSAVDEDLEKAAGNLAKEPDRWVINFSTSLLPTTPSDSYYREALRELNRYNGRLVTGDAVFERRGDNLLATLDRIALDLGASSAAIDQYIRDQAGGFLPDFGVDNLFYQIKGQTYAYALILHGLRKDFEPIINDRELAPLFDALMVSMRSVATLDPMIVTNGARDGFLANHLSAQGFYLLRARTQLREVTNILLK